MIVKVLGLILIGFGAGGAARSFLCLCRERIHSLHAAGQMLELMQGELNTSNLPLAQIMDAISPRLNDPALGFCLRVREGMPDLGRRSFAEIWTSCLRACFPVLSGLDLQDLEELGGVLGRYELSRQTEALSRCRQALKEREKNASAAFTDKRRLVLGLAFTGTALLGIILF